MNNYASKILAEEIRKVLLSKAIHHFTSEGDADKNSLLQVSNKVLEFSIEELIGMLNPADMDLDWLLEGSFDQLVQVDDLPF